MESARGTGSLKSTGNKREKEESRNFSVKKFVILIFVRDIMKLSPVIISRCGMK